MSVDWTKPIAIAATDWQDELPATVLRPPNEYGHAQISIDEPHKVSRSGTHWLGGASWWFFNGACMLGSDIRVINKETGDE